MTHGRPFLIFFSHLEACRTGRLDGRIPGLLRGCFSSISQLAGCNCLPGGLLWLTMLFED